jgi:hypothetical protein
MQFANHVSRHDEVGVVVTNALPAADVARGGR